MLKILLAVPKSDCHCVVNQLLSLFLTEFGHQVVNLGTNSSSSEIATGIRKYSPDLVLVSCQNGHAVEDLDGLSKYISTQNSIPIWIGGKLTTHGEPTAEEKNRLNRAGITKIFPTNARLTDIIIELKNLEKQNVA